MNTFRFLFLVTASFVLAGTVTFAERVTPEYAKQNLDLVPATDPAATDAPKLLPAVKGQHPRLLYTQDEIATLKTRIPGDPILKAAYDQNLAIFKRFKFSPPAPDKPPAIVLDDTSALSSSMERYAGLAYFYSLDKDPATKQNIIDILTMMKDQPYWNDSAELDSNMGCSVNMLMMAVLFDAVCNDLEPAFRAQVADAILTHARRMYYLGFMQKSLIKNKYWQQDPQPNHRWYRIAGTVASLIVLDGEPNIKTDYLLQEMKKEMDFVMKSYPPDGDCHEGAGYQTFGFASILRAAQIMDRNLGTTYLKDTGLSKAWSQQIYYAAPAGGSHLSFGDDMNNPGVFTKLDAAFFGCMGASRDKDAQAVYKRYYTAKAVTADPKRPYNNPWDMLEFYDPTVGEGDVNKLPTTRLFADLGAASFRNSWEADATLFTFKCGPSGGYKLNEYRQSHADQYGNGHYINVAHDDPDANSFAMATGADFMFHPGLYSFRKISEQLSTITVDNKGQINEGIEFGQPVDGVDMRTLAGLTGWKQGEHGRAIIEGEAAHAYVGMNYKELYAWQYPETVPPPGTPATAEPLPKHAIGGPIKPPPPPVLKRYRRTAVWMPGDYILLLDDIRGEGKHDIMWRGTVQKGQIDNAAEGRCHSYSKNGTQCDFQILADKDFNGALDYEFLDGRFGSFLAQQFQFSLNTDEVRFATCFDPWKKKPTLTLKKDGDTVTLNVKSATYDDTWTWKAAKDDTTPSQIEGKRAGASLIALTESDKAPKD